MAKYEALRPERRNGERPPAKHMYPKGFHKTLETYGQQARRLMDNPALAEFLRQYRYIVVEGMNDVLNLEHHNVYSEAICENQMGEHQIPKVIERARMLTGGRIALWYDGDEAGEKGMREDLWRLQLVSDLDVRLACARQMFDGRFVGKQPEDFTLEELREAILPPLRAG